MSAIVTADTHWNDNPRDESRWGLLDWLAEQDTDELIILGDLTVAKNNHPARMVNRLIDKFMVLSKKYKAIYILKGNHDYTDPNCPFFGFISHFSENMLFISRPQALVTTLGKWVFMPAGTDWSERLDLIRGCNVFAHCTFDGAISETGYQLTGVDPRYALEAARVISGDVHKNQTMFNGAIEYVGAPYHTRFGDDFDPHILRMEQGKYKEYLHYPSPRKHTFIIKSLDDLSGIKIKSGDQIKIVALLQRSDLSEWKSWRSTIQEHAEAQGWQLFGPELKLQSTVVLSPTTSTRQSNTELIRDYATRQNASEQYIEVGQELLKSAT